ncbi:MAG: HAMP domain-containing protein [Candidatus Hydrogenedentes bacterium]|nr:HAMP domain-containing protein [Candidatus Hydrogenedentota bacterium]
MPRKRLIWQLFPLFVLVAVVALLLAATYASHTVQQLYRAAREADLEARARLILPQVTKPLLAGDGAVLQSLCKGLGEAAGARVTLIAPDGKVVADSSHDVKTMDNHGDRPEVIAAMRGDVGRARRYSFTLRAHLSYVALPILEGGTVRGIVRIAVTDPSLTAAIRGIYWELALAVLLVGLAVAVLSLIAARTVTRPLDHLKQGAERFAKGQLESRLTVPESSELGQLADAMNTMAAQLEERIHTVERQRNESAAVLSSMVEGVIAFDSAERIISLNDAAAKMFGISQERAVNRAIHEVIRNTELQRMVAVLLDSGGPVDGVIVLNHEEEEHISVQGAALSNAQGLRIGGLVVLHDVTRLIRLENARKDFVTNVSHEIKTPITTIKGYVETLLDGAKDDPEASRRFLEVISRQADRLAALVDDLLRLSRIEQEALDNSLPTEAGLIAEVLKAAATTCEEAANAKHIRIAIICDPALQIPMNARLLQVAVLNLLENAIKYSNENTGIELKADREDDEIVISVQDQGCGIGKEHLPRIFERFYRVDKARSRKQGGTGLGLAIVKHIARIHGGKATVESIPQQGSTFRIHLPASVD